MARTPTPRRFYDLEISRLTGMIRAVELDEVRGSEWKELALTSLRRSVELLSQAAPPDAAQPANRRRAVQKAG